MNIDDEAIDQREVFGREWRDIRCRRNDEVGSGPPTNLTGLALSGGGIRSATFCLGVLQALAERSQLARFDYLSTVSGGGFIGGWWSAWLARDENQALFPPREGIEPATRAETASTPFVEGAWFAGRDPIHHLRLFANYLTPRKGALSPDTWRAITTVSRNLMLTWAVLIPLLMGLLIIAQVYFVVGYGSMHEFLQEGRLVQSLRLCMVPLEHLASIIIVLSVSWLLIHRGDSSFVYLLGIAGVAVATAMVAGFGFGSVQGSSWLGTISYSATWTLPPFALVLYAFRTPGGGIKTDARRDLWRNQIGRVQATVLVATLGVAGTFAIAGLGYCIVTSIWTTATARITGVGSLLATIGTAIVTAYKVTPTGGGDRDRTESGTAVKLAIAIAPPLVMTVVALLAAWATGALVQETVSDAVLSYPVYIATAMCAGFALVDLYLFEGIPDAATIVLVLLLAALAGTIAAAQTDAIGPWALVPAVLAGITIAIDGWRGQSGRRSMWLLGAAIALLTADVMVTTPSVTNANVALLHDLHVMLCFVALCVVWVVGLGWMTDPNMVSLHCFYKARLVRAYLGASNGRRYRESREITEAATGDDVLLRDLKNCDKGGPYHIVNTTLNLVGGRDLTTAQRCAAAFTLARHHCGSWRTRYRRTDDYMGGDLSLGTAVAISGAAASPNMGSSTPSSALALLMTFMNVRLGFWAPTPNRNDWRSPQARMWPFYLLKESLSQTNDLTTYCYLTDGGHFDNTGIYSLVERGCRYIVAVDCGADPSFCFEDLGNAIRRCRIDFDLDVRADLSQFSSPTRRHFIVARIVYSERHVVSLGWTDLSLKAREGVIVVIKPAVVDGQPPDTWQYHNENKVFPQQTTADQWFDEAQFESYRRLGEASAVAAVDECKGIGNVETFFEKMYEDFTAETARRAGASSRTASAALGGNGAAESPDM